MAVRLPLRAQHRKNRGGVGWICVGVVLGEIALSIAIAVRIGIGNAKGRLPAIRQTRGVRIGGRCYRQVKGGGGAVDEAVVRRIGEAIEAAKSASGFIDDGAV